MSARTRAATPLPLLVLLLVHPRCGQSGGVPLVPRRPAQRLIIDTDMSSDCDDVGAVCIAHALMDRGEAELVAVVHNTGLDTGAGAIAAINQYYGRPMLPIGAYVWPSPVTPCTAHCYAEQPCPAACAQPPR